jgi:hypothetical protein
MPSKCATCLICSILTTLTSYNCCSKHLSLLINNKNSHSNHQKQTTDMQQWSPQQVMIVPMTDELIQRYLNPQEIYRLRTRTATSSIQKEPVQSKRSVGQEFFSFKQNLIWILDSKKINNNIRTIRY